MHIEEYFSHIDLFLLKRILNEIGGGKLSRL